MLKDILEVKDIARIQTAATYQMYHTLMIAILAGLYQFKPLKIIQQSAWIFVLGIILFSGSLYLYSFTHYHPLVFLTPIGGILLIVGWLNLIRMGFVNLRF
jgi:uncharacterized membrane protein YgdD (TMEM256/DUF423 family)